MTNVTRREFLRRMAAGLGTLGSLLAGCRPLEKLVTPTSAPVPLPTATPSVPPRRLDIIKMYPDVLSKVVRARHAGVWDGEALAPGAIRQMLDASITELTGLDDATEAWAALFAPEERIAIKVNTIQNSAFWTHVPLVMAVVERLQAVGIPPEQIVIFDRRTRELERADYPVNQDGPGVRCYGTERDYAEGWTLMDASVRLSDVLLSCDALINVPLLKEHGLSGITFAMKNHYGSFDRPSRFHGSRIERAIPELNDLQPIRDRARLIIGDALSIVKVGWQSAVTGDTIFMSFDPVAHDTVGLQLYREVMDERSAEAAMSRANPWLENGAKLGLGTNDPDNMEVVEVSLG